MLRFTAITTMLITAITLSACVQKVEPIMELEPETPPKPFVPIYHQLFFEFDSAELPDNALAILQPHIDYLRENRRRVVLLTGSASASGTQELNYTLALKRAMSVQEFLLANGVMDAQIMISSVGASVHNEPRYQSVTLTY